MAEPKWSESELSLLKDLGVNRRLPVAVIAKELNRTISAVKSQMFKNGYRRKALPAIKESNREFCESVKKLHAEGHTNRRIAKFLNRHHATINNYVKMLQLIPNGNTNEPVDVIDGKSARCSKCREIKPLDEFIINRRGQKYEYRFSYCNDCRRKQLTANINRDIRSFLQTRWRRLKGRCARTNIPMTIDTDYLISLHEKQRGLCFYTGNEMICKCGIGLNRGVLSVDKLIPELGYVPGNVVLCTLKANTIKSDLTMGEIKSWLPPWYKKITGHLKLHGMTIPL